MQNSITKPIGILGGTFDPVHIGHIKIANELLQHFNWQEIRLIPCRQPVLPKNVQASAQQRLEMLKLALKNTSGLTIDERELNRNTPSYTVDTLLSLRKEFPQTPLCWVMGTDALNNLNQWHNWEELLTLAHIVVIPRPNYQLPTQGPIAELLKKHQIMEPTLLEQRLAGAIYLTHLMPLEVSSTSIRQQIIEGLSPYHLLPKGVWDYIEQNKLYQK